MGRNRRFQTGLPGNPTIIYIRAEINPNEYRCPIVPQNMNQLLQLGIIVFVESSKNRIYKDYEYEKEGAIITKEPWYSKKFQSGLIIGLKEIPNMEKLDNHKHIYFSHSFKNQINCEIILKAFSKSNSIIYDYEFLFDDFNKRVIAFGFYAGFVGCCLGLIQYYKKITQNENINNLYPYDSKIELLSDVQRYINSNKSLNIAVIGSNGRCGKGAITVLEYFNIKFNKINRSDNKKNLEEYDIILNCIKLDNDLEETWLDNKTKFFKSTTIVDISCDYNIENNPIKINNKLTTWEKPVNNYNEYVDIISINNLPSLLPRDSSNEFSEILVKLLINFDNDSIWKNNKNYFFKMINYKEEL